MPSSCGVRPRCRVPASGLRVGDTGSSEERGRRLGAHMCPQRRQQFRVPIGGGCRVADVNSFYILVLRANEGQCQAENAAWSTAARASRQPTCWSRCGCCPGGTVFPGRRPPGWSPPLAGRSCTETGSPPAAICVGRIGSFIFLPLPRRKNYTQKLPRLPHTDAGKNIIAAAQDFRQSASQGSPLCCIMSGRAPAPGWTLTCRSRRGPHLSAARNAG